MDPAGCTCGYNYSWGKEQCLVEQGYKGPEHNDQDGDPYYKGNSVCVVERLRKAVGSRLGVLLTSSIVDLP